MFHPGLGIIRVEERGAVPARGCETLLYH